MAEIAIGIADYECVNAVNAADFKLEHVAPPQLFDLRTSHWYEFSPAADITPLESVHCTILLLVTMRAHAENKGLDWMVYVRTHGIDRHFQQQATADR